MTPFPRSPPISPASPTSSIEGRKAIVCLVGENIRATRGIAAQVFDAISDIDVRMISQGASEINLSFVIEEADVPRAVNALHQRFFSDIDPEVFA